MFPFKATATRLYVLFVLLLVVAAAGVSQYFLKAEQPADVTPPVAPVSPEAAVANSLRQALEQLGNGNTEQGIAALRAIDAPERAALIARQLETSQLIELGRLTEAEKALAKLENLAGDSAEYILLRNSLLTSAGRRWESLPTLKRAVELRLPGLMQTLVYIIVIHEMPAANEDYLLRLRDADNAYAMLSLGRFASAAGMVQESLNLFGRALEQRPGLTEAAVQFTGQLLNLGEPEAFVAWQAKLPEGSENHPMLWLWRGRYLQEQGDRHAALHCYLKCLELDPNQEQATYQVGQVLSALGRPDDAAPYLDRALSLGKLASTGVQIYETEGGDVEIIRECIEHLLNLGRFAEADAWCDILASIDPNDGALESAQEQLASQGPRPLPWLATSQVERLPKPEVAEVEFPWAGTTVATKAPTGSEAPPVRIRFEDQASQLGIDFCYTNRRGSGVAGRRMYEFTGGGTIVADFDRDSWPDIHFTQASHWPDGPGPDPGITDSRLDHHYRNRGGSHFTNIAEQAGVADRRYGQGGAAGDFDDDGFDDLYLANLDGNKLYRNNGDGTFSDVTATAGLPKSNLWTSSAAIADINSDGIADILNVNYLTGDDVFSRVCSEPNGVAVACSPKAFPAADNDAFIGTGDGSFVRLDSNSGLYPPDGDGLGVLIADFNNSPPAEILVANDERPSFFFTPAETTTSHVESWNEDGLFSGLAVNGYGHDQANMGITTADVNGDGLLDIFVTNYFQQSNTLFVNQGNNTFLDQTRGYGLAESSWDLLGFGTQFLDADLDGWQDLVIVNGHVDDFSASDTPYQMRAQFYRNESGKRFQELLPGDDLVGGFFSSKRLGRGLAILDWNRDGRDDFVVSDLEQPAALVTNLTEIDAAWIGLSLVGRQTHRNAVGAMIEVRRDSERLVRQVTAGDGYFASNSRQLTFGLGGTDSTAAGTVSVSVKWPSGQVDHYRDIAPNLSYTIVEGRESVCVVQ